MRLGYLREWLRGTVMQQIVSLQSDWHSGIFLEWQLRFDESEMGRRQLENRWRLSAGRQKRIICGGGNWNRRVGVLVCGCSAKSVG